MATGTTPGGAASDFPMADDAARERGRLRESEARIAGQVVEFQLARQRAELVVPELIEPLSTREGEVLELLAVGRTDGEIAEALFISKKTASVHVANIKGKLGAASRVEIALIAERLGLVGAPTDGASADGTSSAAWAVARAGRPGELCPFKGLAPFEAVDAPFFFGRERLVAAMVARLVGATCLAVVGPSGSGKSSAVRAGLLPALAGGVLPGSEGWARVLIRPGREPLATLRAALHDAARERGTPAPDDATITELRDRLTSGTRLSVAIDQFEETFTLCPLEAERSAFVDALVALADDPAARSVVVLAIRADFYGRCAAYPRLAALVGESTILVGPPTAQELERAIEGPARAAGLRVEPELTAELVGDVTGEPGALPLLSTTLLDLWSRRDGRVLRSATYRQIGGVSGAVARLADAAYGRLTAEQGDVARGVLLRLAATGEGDVVVRRPVPLAELDADRDPDVRRVLDVLADARLVTIDGGTVEVAHEALLRDWPRFVDWLEADREGRRVRDHLTNAAREWQRNGEDPGELLRGARLAATLDWAGSHQVELNALERRFLEACRSAAEREVAHERRMNRRLRWLLTGTVGLLIVALVTGSFAYVQMDRAETEAARAASEAERAEGEATRAEAEATLARSRELSAASVASLGEDPVLSKLLAIAAADLAPVDAGLEAALHRAMAADAAIDRTAIPTNLKIGALVTDLHPNGDRLVASGALGSESDTVTVIDLASDAEVWRFEPSAAPAVVGPAYFSPDGERVVAAVSWAPGPTQSDHMPPGDLGVILLDAQTGRVLERLDTGPCGAELLASSATVAMIAVVVPSVDADPTMPPDCFTADVRIVIETIDLASGRRTPLVSDTYGDGALSRDGRFAAITDIEDDDRSIVVDLSTGERVLRLDRSALPQRNRVVRALSPDGRLMLYGDRPMMVYDVESGRAIATLFGDGGESFGAEFAPLGETVYAVGRDGTLRVWDARTGDRVYEAPSIGGGRPSASLDGLVLVGDYTSGIATTLDPRRRGEAATVETCSGFAPGGQLASAGRSVVFSVACLDGHRTYVIDPTTLEPVTTIPETDGQGIGLSPDGTRITTQSTTDGDGGRMQILDARTGEVVATIESTCDWDGSLPVDRHLAGPACKPYPATPFPVWLGSVVYSSDGRMVMVVDDYSLSVWDATSGALLKAMPVDEYVWSAIFTPDGSGILAATEFGELVRVSTATWEVMQRAQLDPTIDDIGRTQLVGFLPDGTLTGVTGFTGTGGGSLLWIDPDRFAIARPPVRIHDGSPKSFALTGDGRRIATGASDGVVRVWDAATGDLLHDLRVRGQAQGVAFLDDDRLAVVPATGDMQVFHLDRDALLNAARTSLTRGFTPEECQRFGFGVDCPTLEEMRRPAPTGG